MALEELLFLSTRFYKIPTQRELKTLSQKVPKGWEGEGLCSELEARKQSETLHGKPVDLQL